MRAARINEYGDAKVVTIEEIDTPTAQDGQVVVEVHASSLNPFDSTIRAGYLQHMMPLELPVTLGGDIAGTVTEVGEGVTNVAVGDKVYGQANVVAGNSGAFAEYAATAASQVAKAPPTLTFQEAALLPLVGVSAWQALTQHTELKPNQKIFITGGAGGIGRIAIQIAKHIGAYVATTATGDGIEVATSLGADEVIDYTTQKFTDSLHDFDAAFDTVGGDELNQILEILKDGGIAVTMAGQFDETKTQEHNITALSQMTHVTTDALDALRELVESGIVKPAIGKVFTLDQIQEAFEARESGSIVGKVVLEIKK